jgi:cofilin
VWHAQATGVSVADEVVTTFNNFKLKREPHNYKFIVYKIENNSRIVIESTGEPTATYEDFVAALPPDDCRYGLLDFDYETIDGRTTDKLVLIAWYARCVLFRWSFVDVCFHSSGRRIRPG